MLIKKVVFDAVLREATANIKKLPALEHVNAIDAILSGCATPQVAADFLTEQYWNLKPEVLTLLVQSMLGSHEQFRIRDRRVFGIASTGGIGLPFRYNISTAAALVAHAAYKTEVVKLGNHGSQSGTGCIDFLSRLDIPGDKLTIANAQRTLEAVGLGFLSAQTVYPELAQVTEARRLMIGPSVFNCMGPLLNPMANVHLIGVFARETLEAINQALGTIGEGWTYYSEAHDQRFDEILPMGTTHLSHVYDIKKHSVTRDHVLNLSEHDLVPSQLTIAAFIPEDAEQQRRFMAGLLSGDLEPHLKTFVAVNAAMVRLGDVGPRWLLVPEDIKRAEQAIERGLVGKLVANYCKVLATC